MSTYSDKDVKVKCPNAEFVAKVNEIQSEIKNNGEFYMKEANMLSMMTDNTHNTKFVIDHDLDGGTVNRLSIINFTENDYLQLEKLNDGITCRYYKNHLPIDMKSLYHQVGGEKQLST